VPKCAPLNAYDPDRTPRALHRRSGSPPCARTQPVSGISRR